MGERHQSRSQAVAEFAAFAAEVERMTCECRGDRRHSWRRVSEGGFDKTRYNVVPLAEKVAKKFILTHHYSGSYPAARQRYGLVTVTGDELVGVAILGEPMHPKVLTKPFPTLDKGEAAELSRLVLLDTVPANGESHFVRKVFKAAAADGLRGVVAFADPLPRSTACGRLVMPGHVGTIYQSLIDPADARWGRYTGRGTSRTLTLLPDGTVLTDRARSKVRKLDTGWAYVVARLVALGAPPLDSGTDPGVWLAAALAHIGARKVRHAGNHRYCWPIGDRGQRRRTPIALEPESFPKQADLALARLKPTCGGT